MEKNREHLYPDVPPPYTPSAESSLHPVGYPNAPPPSHNPKYQPNYNSEPPAPVPQIIQARIIPIGPDPIIMICSSCNAEIRTEIRHEPSTRTHLMALLILLLCWPFTCVPYCVDSCQNANHYCPNCDAYIGSYQH